MPLEGRSLYPEFIKSIEISGVRVRSLRVELKPAQAELQVYQDKQIKVAVDYKATLDGEQKRIFAEAIFSLDAFAVIEGKRRKLAVIKGVWDVFYRVNPPFIDKFINEGSDEVLNEILEIFSRSNVPINVWPYIRAEVAHLSLEMGLPPITLHVIRRV